MHELPERSQFESRLPEEPAYWNELAARITDSAEPILRERRMPAAWWQPLARWSPAIGVAAAAAAIVAFVTIPEAAVDASRPSFEELLTPPDPIARAAFGSGDATAISALLLVESGGQP